MTCKFSLYETLRFLCALCGKKSNRGDREVRKGGAKKCPIAKSSGLQTLELVAEKIIIMRVFPDFIYKSPTLPIKFRASALSTTNKEFMLLQT